MEERFFHFQLTVTVMARHKHMMPWKYEMIRLIIDTCGVGYVHMYYSGAKKTQSAIFPVPCQ